MPRSIFFFGVLVIAACNPGPGISVSPAKEPSAMGALTGASPQPHKAVAMDHSRDSHDMDHTPGTGTTPLQPVRPLTYHHSLSRGVPISMVCFDDRQYRLRVADQPAGPGSKWKDAKSAGLSNQGLAAINGGFFTPEGNPLGLLIEEGAKRGHINQSSLGAGIFATSKSGSAIIRRNLYKTSRLAVGANNLLQAGPMLVEHGKAVNGLSDDKHRTRSFIAWDGEHHWAIAYADSCSLAALAKALTHSPAIGFKVYAALNLDGGRSSDLWVGPQVRGGNQTHRSFLNKPVRNYLILTSR